MTIGEQLSTARKARGLTQQQVAEAIHVTRQTISSWEVGRSYPDLASVLALGDFFALSLDQLLKGDARMMADARIKEQERKSAKVMYWASFAVNLVLLALALMTHYDVVGMQLGTGASVIVAVVLLLNLVVMLYATRRYAAMRGTLNPKRQRRALFVVGGLLLLGLAIAVVVQGLNWWLLGAVSGVVVAGGFAWFVWRH